AGLAGLLPAWPHKQPEGARPTNIARSNVRIICFTMCTFVCRISAIKSAYLAILNQAGSNRRDVVWWTHMILLNLVEECPIAHFQQAGCRLAVPLGLLKRGGDRIPLGFPFHALQKRFETRARTFIGRNFRT